ncbi:hypothetical protein LOK49_LG02G03616 [Camellia lanceoleosa]|uniref:Uncharacterized protein n=1 Tax=Camellia lanceoleosa TaxID=1840588 RepID=A0ACC0IVJ9_9ERIC|nr:hypothetical protein LOK49_LG02G03616 [Camellia lanceoleosa]
MMSAFPHINADHSASPNFEKSSEDEDHLIRSTKKIKSANLVEDQPMEPKMVMETEELGENSRMQDPSPPQPSLPKSFKAALTESKTRDYFFDDRVELFLSDEEDEQQEDQKGGPWVIMDHYLTMRRWEPNFKPSEALETKTPIWVRFPELPIEYY